MYMCIHVFILYYLTDTGPLLIWTARKELKFPWPHHFMRWFFCYGNSSGRPHHAHGRKNELIEC